MVLASSEIELKKLTPNDTCVLSLWVEANFDIAILLFMESHVILNFEKTLQTSEMYLKLSRITVH